MKSLQIDDSFLVNKWVLTFFLYNVPFQAALNFWDTIIAKGIFLMVNINVALIWKIESHIMVIKMLRVIYF